MAVSDYAKLKVEVVKARAFNKVHGWKVSEAWCRQTRKSAEELQKRIEKNTKNLKVLSINGKGFYKDFIRIAKIISDQQSDLVKAKKAKDKRKMVELEKKIAILDKEARKLGDKFNTDTADSETLFKEIELIQKGLEKV